MKFRWDNKYLYWGVTAFCVVAASLLFCFGIFRMGTLIQGIKAVLRILMPIIYGAILAYLLNPVVNFLEKKVIFRLLEKKGIQISKKLAKFIRYTVVLLSLALFAFLIYALVMMILPELIRSIISIINSFPGYVNSIQEWISKLMENNDELNATMMAMFQRYSAKAETFLTQDILPQLQQTLRHVSAGVFDAINFLKNVLIGAIVSIYILADKEGFVGRSKMILYSLFSTKRANAIIHNMRFTHRTFGGFINGKILDSIIIGILCYIGTSILDMPYDILVSVIVGVTNVIPFFGPYLGAIPCAILILLVDPLKCLYFVIFILILQQFDGNILGPKILGESTGLSSFMVILAILVGGGFFGIFGMLVGVPVCAVIYALIWNTVEKSLKRKKLPSDLDAFRSMDCVDPVTNEAKPFSSAQKTDEEDSSTPKKDA
ncbi:MAG: AI-2E family transporter [Blautia sp.]|jgi:predicted PurR-regulated permease PerM